MLCGYNLSNEKFLFHNPSLSDSEYPTVGRLWHRWKDDTEIDCKEVHTILGSTNSEY